MLDEEIQPNSSQGNVHVTVCADNTTQQKALSAFRNLDTTQHQRSIADSESLSPKDKGRLSW